MCVFFLVGFVNMKRVVVIGGYMIYVFVVTGRGLFCVCFWWKKREISFKGDQSMFSC